MSRVVTVTKPRRVSDVTITAPKIDIKDIFRGSFTSYTPDSLSYDSYIPTPPSSNPESLPSYPGYVIASQGQGISYPTGNVDMATPTFPTIKIPTIDSSLPIPSFSIPSVSFRQVVASISTISASISSIFAVIDRINSFLDVVRVTHGSNKSNIWNKFDDVSILGYEDNSRNEFFSELKDASLSLGDSEISGRHSSIKALGVLASAEDSKISSASIAEYNSNIIELIRKSISVLDKYASAKSAELKTRVNELDAKLYETKAIVEKNVLMAEAVKIQARGLRSAVNIAEEAASGQEEGFEFANALIQIYNNNVEAATIYADVNNINARMYSELAEGYGRIVSNIHEPKQWMAIKKSVEADLIKQREIPAALKEAIRVKQDALIKLIESNNSIYEKKFSLSRNKKAILQKLANMIPNLAKGEAAAVNGRLMSIYADTATFIDRLTFGVLEDGYETSLTKGRADIDMAEAEFKGEGLTANAEHEREVYNVKKEGISKEVDADIEAAELLAQATIEANIVESLLTSV